MCDVYATIEASRLLGKLAAEEMPAPLRRMLHRAIQKLDEDVEDYFKPGNGRDLCVPRPALTAQSG